MRLLFAASALFWGLLPASASEVPCYALESGCDFASADQKAKETIVLAKADLSYLARQNRVRAARSTDSDKEEAAIDRQWIQEKFGIELPASASIHPRLVVQSGWGDSLMGFGTSSPVCLLAWEDSDPERERGDFRDPAEFLAIKKIAYSSRHYALIRRSEDAKVAVAEFTVQASALTQDPLMVGLDLQARESYTAHRVQLTQALSRTPRCP